MDASSGRIVRRGAPTSRAALPAGAEFVPAIPALAGKRSLSDAERDLARYVHLLLPAGSRPEEWLDQVRSWEFVDSAQLPPAVSLP